MKKKCTEKISQRKEVFAHILYAWIIKIVRLKNFILFLFYLFEIHLFKVQKQIIFHKLRQTLNVLWKKSICTFLTPLTLLKE